MLPSPVKPGKQRFSKARKREGSYESWFVVGLGELFFAGGAVFAADLAMCPVGIAKYQHTKMGVLATPATHQRLVLVGASQAPVVLRVAQALEVAAADEQIHLYALDLGPKKAIFSDNK